MLKEVSSLKNMPLVSLSSDKRLGEASDFVFDPESGKFLAFSVGSPLPFHPVKFVSSSDIYEISSGAIWVRDDSALLELDEMVRVKNIKNQKIKVLGNKAITESGRKLGRVSDVVIDIDTLFIAKIYIGSGFVDTLVKGDLIIPISKILGITKKAVIVSDDIEKEKIKQELPEPA